jgi:hypothetical protein
MDLEWINLMSVIDNVLKMITLVNLLRHFVDGTAGVTVKAYNLVPRGNVTFLVLVCSAAPLRMTTKTQRRAFSGAPARPRISPPSHPDLRP